MGGFTSSALFWILSAIALAGALYVLLAREVMSVVLGLGTVLLGLAGLFAYFGFGFLALAQLFLYVGGVLVLFLFAIMLVHRAEGGAPSMANRPDPLFIAASSALGLLVFAMLSPAAPEAASVVGAGGPSQIAGVLLGEMLPQFEAVGVLLLLALVAVVLVMAGDRR
jgi:NADH-quinone oxidoreductase subunit J